MPRQTLPELFGSEVDPLDLMRAEDDGMFEATVALMSRTFEAVESARSEVLGEYADQRGHDVFWMTAAERSES